jgi:HlyD family secretion protein
LLHLSYGRIRAAHVLLVLGVAALGLYALRQWQGPQVAAYQVSQQALLQQVVASGTVSSQALARIGSEITGVVKKRHVREGDRVQPGSVLLELNDDEQQARLREAQAALAELTQATRPQAEAALREAENALTRAEDELTRRETLHAREQLATEVLEQARSAVVAARAGRDSAQAQLGALAAGGSRETQLRERLASAEAALAKTRILATVHGTVQSRAAEPGDVVQPGRTLFEIWSDDSREILVPVDERNFGLLALDQQAQVIADAFPDEVLAATVNFLAPAIDTTRGTVDVHLALATDAPFLRQGMTVSATITTATRASALVAGNDLLRNVRGDEAEIWRVRDGRVEAVPVTLGLRGIVASEILSGIADGDIVLPATVTGVVPGDRVRTSVQDAAPGDTQ